jgi:hypothetical protein
MKINTGETPLEPIFIPDGQPGAKSRSGNRTGKGEKAPFEVFRGGEHWESEFCTLPFKRLVSHHDLVRAVVVRLEGIYLWKNWNEYLDVLRYIESKLMPAVRAYDNLAAEPPEPEKGKQKENWDLLSTLLRNVCRCIPNEASERMIRDFYDRLQAREGELKQPHFILRPVPDSAPSCGAVEFPATQSKPSAITQEHLRALLATSGFDRMCAEENVRKALIDGGSVEPGPVIAFLRRDVVKRTTAPAYTAISVIICERRNHKNRKVSPEPRTKGAKP